MKTITYEAAAEQETVSAFLMMVLEFGDEQGVFDLLEAWLDVKKTEVIYTRLQKVQTVMASLVMGCKHTNAVNAILSQEQTAALYVGMERFPDQCNYATI
jgi:hypothetical protein